MTGGREPGSAVGSASGEMERHESYAPGADVAYLELVLAGLGRGARVEEVNCENLFGQTVSTTSRDGFNTKSKNPAAIPSSPNRKYSADATAVAIPAHFRGVQVF